MKRSSILLPDDLADRLEEERRRRGVSASQVVQQALTAYLAPNPPKAQPLPFVALGHSGQKDTAREAEAILVREWANDRGR